MSLSFLFFNNQYGWPFMLRLFQSKIFYTENVFILQYLVVHLQILNDSFSGVSTW